MTRTRWPVGALASVVMVGAVTLVLPGSASAATWQVMPAQAYVVPDSATDAWGSIMNFPYDGSPDTTDVVHLSGTTWNSLTVPGLPGDTTAAVAGDSPTDAWAVWNQNAAHYDGSSWTTYNLGSYSNNWSVAIVSPTNVWAAGSNRSTLEHWDGTTWSQVTVPSPAGYPTATVAAADGLGASGGALSASGGDLWVTASVYVGYPNWYDYFAARWDGTSWSLSPFMPAPGGNISAASATDVWVAGNPAMHYNGSAWSTFQMPAANGVSSIAARGDEAWAAGTSQDGGGGFPPAALWHWDGSTWSSVAFPVDPKPASRAAVHYVPGSNTVWVEATDGAFSGGMVIAAGG